MVFIYTTQGEFYNDNSKSLNNINSSLLKSYNDTKNITCNTCNSDHLVIDNFDTLNSPKSKTVISETDVNRYIENLSRDRLISDQHYPIAYMGDTNQWCSKIGQGWIADGSKERCIKRKDGSTDCATFPGMVKVNCKRNGNQIQFEVNKWLEDKIVKQQPVSNYNYIEKNDIEYSPGIALWAYTWEYIEPTNINDCLKKCYSIPNCEGISYNKDKKVCYFKNGDHVQKEASDSNYISYKKKYIPRTVDIKSNYIEKNDTEYSPGVVTSWDHTIYNIEPNDINNCLEECDRIPNCEGISYNKYGKDCFFKNGDHVQEETSDSNYISYMKKKPISSLTQPTSIKSAISQAGTQGTPTRTGTVTSAAVTATRAPAAQAAQQGIQQLGQPVQNQIQQVIQEYQAALLASKTAPSGTPTRTGTSSPPIIGANINPIEEPNNNSKHDKPTWYSNTIKHPYTSIFYVEYYNKNNTKTISNKITLSNKNYDNPDIYIKFLTPYTGPIKLYRSDNNEAVIKDERYLKNISEIVSTVVVSLS
jgi:hypothetical protein